MAENWPKHVEAVINNNKNTVQQVGNKYCIYAMQLHGKCTILKKTYTIFHKLNP